jgi:hypothetical protein
MLITMNDDATNADDNAAEHVNEMNADDGVEGVVDDNDVDKNGMIVVFGVVDANDVVRC